MLVIKELHSSLWMVISEISFYENSYDGIVFMISGVAFAKISQQRNQATGTICIIDSYDRDENGRASPIDKGVILRFENFIEIANYISDIYVRGVSAGTSMDTLNQYKI